MTPVSATHVRWARLVKKIYEVHPLECPDCGGEMEVIVFIENPRVVYLILDHLDMLSSGTDPPDDSTLTYELIESARDPLTVETLFF